MLEIHVIPASAEVNEDRHLVTKLFLEGLQLPQIPFIAFRVGRLLHFDHDEIVIGVTVMDDDVGENRFGIKIVTADVVTWGKIQPLRVVTIPVVLAVHMPLLEFSL